MERFVQRKRDPSFLVAYRSCTYLALGFILGLVPLDILTSGASCRCSRDVPGRLDSIVRFQLAMINFQTIVALFFLVFSPFAVAQGAAQDIQVEQDISRLLDAASKLDTAWPWQKSIPEKEMKNPAASSGVSDRIDQAIAASCGELTRERLNWSHDTVKQSVHCSPIY